MRILRLPRFVHGPKGELLFQSTEGRPGTHAFRAQIFVRAFDSDERLVGVAFMDVGVYVTSLRTLKNLLLIGDAVKSVMFAAFQVCFILDVSHMRALIFRFSSTGRPI